MSHETTNFDPNATGELPVASPRRQLDSDTKVGSSGLTVRCPNCHAPMEVAVDTALTDLICSTCGSDFSIVDQSKGTAMAPSLTELGRFQLVERLGVGSFGSVWKARDKELDRTVAIKIPRQAAMTSEEQKRVFREARAAAQVRHPNIVAVHEVGRDGDSLYIVSDFVRGVTLSDWLTGQQLTNREAAQLCVKIADALHHAHEQGVVHRDLKPANIMIDGDGQPHLMDFGLAFREVDKATLMTVEGQILGTPAYMSPEQAEGKAHTADRRSDVYSLGVILFQLLTGELPFRGNARMLLHQVIHDEPASLRALNANISRDLNTITLKCLEKEPSRRYQSSVELAEELRRFLAGKPINARPIGRIARSWRWMKRHPAISSMAAMIIAALSLGLAGTAWQWRRAEAARQVAVTRQLETEAARVQETKLRQQSEGVTNFLVDAFQSPANARNGYAVTVEEVLSRAAEHAEQLRDQPDTQAAVLAAIGRSSRALGGISDADRELQKALDIRMRTLGADHAETLRTMEAVASVASDKKRRISLRQEVLTSRRKLLGPDHPDTLASMLSLAEELEVAGQQLEAIKLYEKTVSAVKQILGAEHDYARRAMYQLAIAYLNDGRSEDSIKILSELLPVSGLPTNKHITAEDLAIATEAYNQGGTLDQTVLMASADNAKYQEKANLSRPTSLELVAGLISAYKAAGRIDEITTLFERLLPVLNDRLGATHPVVAMSKYDLAIAYMKAGRQDDAAILCEQLLGQGFFHKGWRLAASLGPDMVNRAMSRAIDFKNPYTPQRIDGLVIGELRLVAGKPEEAEAAMKLGYSAGGAPAGYYHKSFGWCLRALGKEQEARPYFESLLKRFRVGDSNYDLQRAGPDEMVAAYFLDIISEQQFVDHLAKDKWQACFPWFYVAQRREIEDKKDEAVSAYKRCVELSTGIGSQHPLGALAQWRLQHLQPTSTSQE